MGKEKKDFSGAEEMFFTQQEPEPVQIIAPEPFTIQAKPETKSKRLQLLIYPTLDKALDKEARRLRISKNDLANKIFAAYIEKAKGAKDGN